GDGPQRQELEASAARRMPERCIFFGSLDDPRLAYWSSDLLLFPTRGGDSMPAVLIEAGLCGLASITTDVGAITEVIDHGTTGLVVPEDSEKLASAVAALVSDATRRSAMGAAAAGRCSERFTIARTASAWLEVLSSVCAQPGARRSAEDYRRRPFG